jgi:hypothetical protein
MTRPPNRRHRSRPAVTARAATTSPSHRRALPGRERERAVRVPTTRGPGERTSLATRTFHRNPFRPPLHRVSLPAALPPLRLSTTPDRRAVRPAPRIVRSIHTDPQSDVARAVRLGRHLRSRYRCSMCSAVRTDSRTLLRSSSIHEPSDPPSKVIIDHIFLSTEVTSFLGGFTKLKCRAHFFKPR